MPSQAIARIKTALGDIYSTYKVEIAFFHTTHGFTFTSGDGSVKHQQDLPPSLALLWLDGVRVGLENQ